RRGSVVTKVELTDKVQPGMIWMSFHFRETPTNELTVNAFDPVSKTGEYKVAAVRLEKVRQVKRRGAGFSSRPLALCARNPLKHAPGLQLSCPSTSIVHPKWWPTVWIPDNTLGNDMGG